MTNLVLDLTVNLILIQSADFANVLLFTSLLYTHAEARLWLSKLKFKLDVLSISKNVLHNNKIANQCKQLTDRILPLLYPTSFNYMQQCKILTVLYIHCISYCFGKIYPKSLEIKLNERVMEITMNWRIQLLILTDGWEVAANWSEWIYTDFDWEGSLIRN